MAQESQYYPPVSQPYQHRILVYEVNGLIGHRLVQQFRNDHVIEVNPNLIFGTLSNQKYANELSIDILIDPDNEKLLNSAIASADFILFPLHGGNTLQLEHLLKFLKCLKVSKKIKVIVISSLFGWKVRGNGCIVKKEDFSSRIANNSAIKQLENLCLGLKTYNANMSGCVLSCGLVYGMGEDTLFPLFKQALQQKQTLKMYGKGNNNVPTVHVDDLCQFVFDIAFSNQDGVHFVADQSKITQRQLIASLAQTLGNGKVDEEPIEAAFLDQNFNIFSSDIQVQPKSLPKISVWRYQSGLIHNLGVVVGEFNSRRGLRPNKILIHGGPASGKSKLAQILCKNYGLPLLRIKNLIQEIKAEDSPFANEIKGILQELKAIKVEQQRKIYEQAKKKKKGKGVQDFDPSKILARLPEKDVCRIVKRRINMADCLNKGYIIDGVLKTFAQNQAVFLNEQGQLFQATFPNSVFNIEASDEEIKDRVKKLPADATQGTHWTEQQTIRRLSTFKQHNQGKKWFTFFQGKVDIKTVPFSYADPSELIAFIERVKNVMMQNGPLGFKVKLPKEQKVAEAQTEQIQKQVKEEAGQQHQAQESDQQEFNLEKLTQSQTKILNEKSRPIRQYLIDNVIPQITEGLLQICKQTPPDPIQFLIHFLQSKRSKKRKTQKT